MKYSKVKIEIYEDKDSIFELNSFEYFETEFKVNETKNIVKYIKSNYIIYNNQIFVVTITNNTDINKFSLKN